MARVRICFEIDGLGVDEHGEACPAGLQIDYGEIPDLNDVSYEALAERIDVPELLRFLHLDHLPVSAVRIITPEEYDEKYGEEDHED